MDTGFGPGYYTVKVGYEFNYNNNALTSIKMKADASGSVISTGGKLNTYMIVRLRS